MWLLEDILHAVRFALFVIVDPRSGFTQVHQRSAKVEPPDVMARLAACCRHLGPDEMLGPRSGGDIFRRR